MQDVGVLNWGNKSRGKVVVGCRFQISSGGQLEGSGEAVRRNEIKDSEAALAKIHPSWLKNRTTAWYRPHRYSLGKGKASACLNIEIRSISMIYHYCMHFNDAVTNHLFLPSILLIIVQIVWIDWIKGPRFQEEEQCIGPSHSLPHLHRRMMMALPILWWS